MARLFLVSMLLLSLSSYVCCYAMFHRLPRHPMEDFFRSREMSKEEEDSSDYEHQSFAQERQVATADDKDIAENRGYLGQSFLPKSVTLNDDYSIESRFPYPTFPKLQMPFDGAFGSYSGSRHRRSAPTTPQVAQLKTQNVRSTQPRSVQLYPTAYEDQVSYGADTGDQGAFRWLADYANQKGHGY